LKGVPELISSLLPDLVNRAGRAAVTGFRFENAVIEEYPADDRFHDIEQVHGFRFDGEPEAAPGSLDDFQDSPPSELLGNLSQELVWNIHGNRNFFSGDQNSLAF